MDERSLRHIATLEPNAQDWAREHLRILNASKALRRGCTVRIIQSRRTYAEQNALFAQGRTKPGQIVTNARGGQSTHNFGIAWDIGVFEGARYLTSPGPYEALVEEGVKLGLECGALWRFKDLPHYNVKTGLSMAELRALVARGAPIPIPPLNVAPMLKKDDSVVILDGNERTDIKAFLEAGRVWVAIRPFVDRFGGEILEVSSGTFTLSLGGDVVSFSGRNIGGSGFVKVADLNRVLGWGLNYAGNELRIVEPGVKND